jgi:DNA-binding CsgD family transcriptional regulator
MLSAGKGTYADIYPERLKVERVLKLTLRHKECLRLVANGYKSKEIAQILKLEYTTINNYITDATNILGERKRSKAAAILAEFETNYKLNVESDYLALANDFAKLDEPSSRWRSKIIVGLYGWDDRAQWFHKVLQILLFTIFSTSIFFALSLFMAGVMKLLSPD